MPNISALKYSLVAAGALASCATATVNRCQQCHTQAMRQFERCMDKAVGGSAQEQCREALRIRQKFCNEGPCR
jgi:hypothetical protein